MYKFLFIFISYIEATKANSTTTTTFEAINSQESSSLAGPIIFGVVVFFIIGGLVAFFCCVRNSTDKRDKKGVPHDVIFYMAGFEQHEKHPSDWSHSGRARLGAKRPSSPEVELTNISAKNIPAANLSKPRHRPARFSDSWSVREKQTPTRVRFNSKANEYVDPRRYTPSVSGGASPKSTSIASPIKVDESPGSPMSDLDLVSDEDNSIITKDRATRIILK